MAKVINIWWVLLLVGLFSTTLPAQSTVPQLKDRLRQSSDLKQQASINYKIAELYLKQRQPQLAVRYALDANKLSQQALNTGLRSGSALLLGKAFIAQNDFTNADLWIKRGINNGKSIKSAPLVIEGSTLLSSIAVRQNQYKQAYEHLLLGINYYNRFPNSNKANPTSSVNPAKLKQLNAQIANLKKREKELLDKIDLSESEHQEWALAIEDSLRSIYATTPEDSTTNDDQDQLEELTQDYELKLKEAKEAITPNKLLGIPHSWWVLGLALLSLGLLAALFWLSNRLSNSEDTADESAVYHQQTQQLEAGHQEAREQWERELRQKELLIEDYKQELFDLQNRKTLAASLFGKGTEKAAKHKAGLMLVDIRASENSSALANPENVVVLENELALLIQQHPDIHLINKIGPTLVFATKPESMKSGTKALVNFAQELKEYFEDRQESVWNAKIAVHSGWLVFAKSDNLPQGVDVWGEELDRCNWLLGQTQPGNITITSDARDEIAQPEGWTYLGEQKDFLGEEIRIFKKT